MALGSSRSILMVACLALSTGFTGSLLARGYDRRGYDKERDRGQRRDRAKTAAAIANEMTMIRAVGAMTTTVGPTVPLDGNGSQDRLGKL